MRAKVIVSAVGLGLAVLLPAMYFHFKPDSPPPAVAPVAADDNAAPAGGLPAILKRTQVHPQEGLPDRPSPAHSSALSHDDYVLERKAELAELGMSDDPADLKTILSEMENPDPGIRKAALTATLSFGSKDAIPTLQNEMNWATDPQEKVDIQKAIDFLQLPHLGESEAVTQQSSGGAAPPTN